MFSRAVEILSRIDGSVAISAKLTHKAARAQTPVHVAHCMRVVVTSC